MKKYMRLIIILLLLVCVILLCGNIKFYREAKEQKSILAERNVSHWSSLLLLTVKIKANPDFENDMVMWSTYHNAVIYDNAFFLQPYFEDSFLTVHYDSFFQDFSRNYKTSQHTQENKKLYLEMNEELNKICLKVLKYSDKGNKEKLSLIDEKSDIHKEIKGEIEIFCEKYELKLKNIRW